ncbi:hypothetical protein C9374_011155 [Naegleria lovaniensis]|uniref:Uncharacterized protein n=1 Tax=Naegleria lovaniensis TaxID=51637 RepID=A0AA88KFH5_NAELO|nr:uncharacterized protein C9374_011155 [Naegleria lovaniensis]KAG2374076.1 hypothetical protein C9374_011155 [Naegleria lovaniensis]
MTTTQPFQSCQNINHDADNTPTTTTPPSIHLHASSCHSTRKPSFTMKNSLMNFAIFENLGIVILTAGLFIKTPSTFTSYPLFDSSEDDMETSHSSYYRYIEMSLLEYCQQCKEANMQLFNLICIVVGVTSMCLALYITHNVLRENKLKTSNAHERTDIHHGDQNMLSRLLKNGHCSLKHVMAIVVFSILSFTSFALLVYMQFFIASNNSLVMTMEQCDHVEWYARTSKILSLVLGSTMNVIGIGCLLRLVVCSFWKKKPAVDQHDATRSVSLSCSSCHSQEAIIASEKV